MLAFEKRSQMPVPREALFAYHARPGALARLIPPWQTARIVESSEHIRDGARVVLDLKVGPIWRRWTAEHFDYVEGRQFRDRQVSGPFKSWTHSHRFEDGPTPGTSVLIDHVEYEPPFAFATGGRARRELERMFAFRHARTRDDLVRHAEVARPLTVAITGANGSIAKNLIPFLTTAGHRVRRLVRGASSDAEAIRWDAATGAVDEAKLAECDALVHLAGRNIFTRWTDKTWREIDDSRVLATRKLCETIARMPRRPGVLVSASAVGYYGDRGEEELTEESARGGGRAAELCERWEQATAPAWEAGIRVVNLRIAVVFSASSGAISQMLTPTKLGLGGPLAGGRQLIPWIAMDDVVSLIDRCVRDETYAGVINGVAGSVRQGELAKTLGRVLHRPAIVPTPAFAPHAIFGQMADELLFASANVRPTLGERGFAPTYPTVEATLRFELGR